MRPNPYIRPDLKRQPEPGLARMVVVSFVIHLALLVLFSGVILPHAKTPPKPVYIVDLVNRPVKNPRSGRPDARPKSTKAEPKPAATAPEPKPEAVRLPPKPETSPEPKPKSEPKAKPEATAKPTPKAKVKPAPDKKKPRDQPETAAKEEQSVASALDKIKRKQEMQGLQDKLAAMASTSDTRGAAVDAPVGMPDGTGDEEGVSSDAWLHEFLKQAWRLSKYQVGRTDLAAEVQLVFNAQGQLLSYKFTEKSGDPRFDDSVTRAILQLKDYPEPTLAGARKDVVFNLKELLK